MLTMKSDTVPANRYNMAKPVEADLLASLAKIIGLEKAQLMLDGIQISCGSGRQGDPLIRLKEKASWLSQQKGIISIVGRSMNIRILSYASISGEKTI